jgi:hypothetical protein
MYASSSFSSSSSSSYRITCVCLHPVRLFSCDIDVQLSHQRSVGSPGSLGLFGFPFFAIFSNQLSFILFTRSFHDRLLILAHLTT